MAIKREVRESPLVQGVDEEIAYTLTTTPWGASPSSITVKVYDITSGDYDDVTATVMPAGSASAVGNVITLPTLKALTANHNYRIEIKFTSGGNVFEPFAIVRAEQ